MDWKAARRRNIGYAGLHGAYWMIYCVAVSYAGVLLLARSYSNSEIGVILAAGYILSILLQPLVAGAADRQTRVSPVVFLTLTALVALLGLVGVFVFRTRSVWLSISFVLFLSTQLVLQPLLNAFAFYLERLETPIAYGIARAFGSFTYAVLSALLGGLVVSRGVGVLPVAAFGSFAILFLLLFLFSRDRTAPRPAPQLQKGEALSFSSLVTRYRGFFYLLAGTALLFFGHSLINNFIIQVVQNVGGTSAQMGTLCSVAALLELPAMLLFDRLHRRFSCTQMAKFAAVFFLVKIILVFFARWIPALCVAQSVRALSFGVLMPATVRYVDETLSPADANKGQAYATATMMIGNIFSSAVGGVLIDRIAVRGALVVGMAVTVAGMLTILLGMKSPKKVAP